MVTNFCAESAKLAHSTFVNRTGIPKDWRIATPTGALTAAMTGTGFLLVKIL